MFPCQSFLQSLWAIGVFIWTNSIDSRWLSISATNFNEQTKPPFHTESLTLRTHLIAALYSTSEYNTTVFDWVVQTVTWPILDYTEYWTLTTVFGFLNPTRVVIENVLNQIMDMDPRDMSFFNSFGHDTKQATHIQCKYKLVKRTRKRFR